MMDYGMFTDGGNLAVHGIVEGARIKKSTWPEVYQALVAISYVDGYGEATDTAVREAVYDALRFETDFYC
jgi:hypothetical protein